MREKKGRLKLRKGSTVRESILSNSEVKIIHLSLGELSIKKTETFIHIGNWSDEYNFT